VNILILSPVDAEAIAALEARHTVIRGFGPRPQKQMEEALADAEVLICRSGVSVDANVLQSASNLRGIIRAGSGTDNLDLEEVRRRGLVFETIPQPGAKAVAEMAFALMLGLARNVLLADALLRRGRWAKHDLTGFGLQGKTLGIIGAGNIGSQTGRLGVAWGMEVLGCVDRRTVEEHERLRAAGITLASFGEVLAAADFVSVHVPLKDSTRNLIDAGALARMKPGSFLVNLARGGVVDETALRAALESGHLAGAALDVHAAEGEGEISPLADLPNVILTPHIGAGTFDAQREIGERILEIVRDIEAQERPPNRSVA
jgi:D-3-phosphoglycerate dehydrogenase / 2-oxoglutarate reductase